ncbi:MAG TPA: C1 family peptidase [Chitinophagales bacterium]|nr:C1 family peptidase [Chitinophagales bacterium]HRK27096.1 C1 family peptidase [Chitinophagales bacterium]
MKKLLFTLFLCMAAAAGTAVAQQFGTGLVLETPSSMGNNPTHGTGLIFDDEAYRKVPMKAPLTRGEYGAIPAAASLKKYCPTPGNQGNTSTCTAWAAAYAAQTILWARANGINDPAAISAKAYSNGYLYRSISDDPSCLSGTNPMDALDVLKDDGNVFKNEVGDLCPSYLSSALKIKAASNTIQDYTTLFYPDDDAAVKITTVKKALAENNPIMIAMLVPQSFHALQSDLWTPTVAESLGQFGCPCGNGTTNITCCGHAMCVVGYDDNKYGGAFEIMNSWGTTWANKGFVWIKYTDFATFNFYAFELINNIKPPTPQPQPKPIVNPVPPPNPQPQPTPPPAPPAPKPQPAPAPVNPGDFDFAGDLRFILSSGAEMKAAIVEVRGLSVVDEQDVAPTPKPAPKPNPTVNPDNFKPDPNLTTGKFIAYRMSKAYSEGTKFRVLLTNNQPAYVYAIAMDGTNQAVTLFPHKPGISPILNYSNSEVALPSETHYITMDNVRGTDVFCLLYSKEPLDINQICRRLEKETGTFFQRLYKTMKHQLVDRQYLRYYNQRMRFEIKSYGTGTVVPIVVEIPHN